MKLCSIPRYATALLSLALLPPSIARAAADSTKPIVLNSRRELLVDDFLISTMEGVELQLHKPEARDVAITCDAPWEGNTSAYFTLFKDEGRFRMYYRASHFDELTKQATHSELSCLAESQDGLAWDKPNLGVVEFKASKENNLIGWEPEKPQAAAPLAPGTPTLTRTHNFAPFKDTSPHCEPGAKYKALAGGMRIEKAVKVCCLYAYHSADGVTWSKTSNEPVITHGAFDSQNIAFYDTVRGEYRAYWRYFVKGYTDERGWKAEVRSIRTATSKDFLHWENEAELHYGDAPTEELYTNAVMAYERAPQLFIAFPTRFQEKNQQVEPVFMTSRDGVNFKRWTDALIPITAPKDRDGNRSNYMARGLLQLPGNDRELSVYATEAYYKGPGSRVRRFVYRTDGFVSAHASEGTLVTKPFTFTGSELVLNILSKGETRAELQDATGNVLPGFALNDCTPITADSIEHVVIWKGGPLSAHSGKPVRLRIALKDADLFALQFKAQ